MRITIQKAPPNYSRTGLGGRGAAASDHLGRTHRLRDGDRETLLLGDLLGDRLALRLFLRLLDYRNQKSLSFGASFSFC